MYEVEAKRFFNKNCICLGVDIFNWGNSITIEINFFLWEVIIEVFKKEKK